MARNSLELEKLLFAQVRHRQAARERELAAEQGKVPTCPCGRKLWATSEIRRGTCATCDNGVRIQFSFRPNDAQ